MFPVCSGWLHVKSNSVDLVAFCFCQTISGSVAWGHAARNSKRPFRDNPRVTWSLCLSNNGFLGVGGGDGGGCNVIVFRPSNEDVVLGFYFAQGQLFLRTAIKNSLVSARECLVGCPNKGLSVRPNKDRRESEGSWSTCRVKRSRFHFGGSSARRLEPARLP